MPHLGHAENDGHLSSPDFGVCTAQSFPRHLYVVDPSEAEHEEGRVAEAEERVGRGDVRPIEACRSGQLFNSNFGSETGIFLKKDTCVNSGGWDC